MTLIPGSSEFPVLLPRRGKSAVGSCLHYKKGFYRTENHRG